MEKFKNKYCLIAVVAGLILGFVGGMEYKAYQIRSAFNDVTDELSDMFNDTGEVEQEEVSEEPESPIREARADENADRAERLRALVDLEVVGKGFTEADFLNGPYDSTIDFSFRFNNQTDREVRGIQGTVVFYDIFENEIFRSNLSYDDGVAANDSYTWEAGIDYNQFMDDHQKLRSMDLEDLQYEWVPDMIIFADGTREE